MRLMHGLVQLGCALLLLHAPSASDIKLSGCCDGLL